MEFNNKLVFGFAMSIPDRDDRRLVYEVLELDPKKGDVNKRYKVGSAVRFQPTVHNGSIFVGTQDGKLVCIKTGNKKNTGWKQWGGNAQRTGIYKK